MCPVYMRRNVLSVITIIRKLRGGNFTFLRELCFQIDSRARVVLWQRSVADLIELVRIKWVGVETCNRPGGRVNIYRRYTVPGTVYLQWVYLQSTYIVLYASMLSRYSVPTVSVLTVYLHCMLSRCSVHTVYIVNIYRRYSVPAVSVLTVYLQCTNSV